MATFLTALAGAVVGSLSVMLAITYIVHKQLENADDLNDASCLTCDRQHCECA